MVWILIYLILLVFDDIEFEDCEVLSQILFSLIPYHARKKVYKNILCNNTKYFDESYSVTIIQ